MLRRRRRGRRKVDGAACLDVRTSGCERAAAQQVAAPEERLRCLIDPTRLVVEVSDNAPLTGDAAPVNVSDSGMDERGLGGVLIRILMDDVQTTTDPESGGTVVRMIKYVPTVTR